MLYAWRSDAYAYTQYWQRQGVWRRRLEEAALFDSKDEAYKAFYTTDGVSLTGPISLRKIREVLQPALVDEGEA